MRMIDSLANQEEDLMLAGLPGGEDDELHDHMLPSYPSVGCKDETAQNDLLTGRRTGRCPGGGSG